MERYWKWLMHANARALFFIALLILLLVLGWCAWVLWRPMQQGRADNTQPAAVVPHTEMALGILACLSNQLTDAQVVPVSPFRPTLESLAANRESITNVLQPRRRRSEDGTGDPFAGLRPNRNVPTTPPPAAPAAPRIPKLTYRGFFTRPDGKTAALFNDSTTDAATFHLPGEEFHGVALLVTGPTRARVRLPGGQERDLVIGESIELPAEAQP
jgi:hypothetical protein